MGIWDFLTADYATRQQRTRDLNDNITGLLDYYLGPTGIPDKLYSANALLNPVHAIGEAGANTVVALDPSYPDAVRRQAAFDAGIGTITSAAPAIGGAIVGQPARRALMETLVGASGQVDDAALELISMLPSGRALAADAMGLGRGILARDPEMIGEVFQPSGMARGLSADVPGSGGLRVYHGTDANISSLDPAYGRTARDLYTTPIRDDAAMYGRNVLEFDVNGKIGDFRPDARGIEANKVLQRVYQDHGLSDYFDSFDEFVNAFDSGDLYQRFGNSRVQDDIIAGLIDEGGFDAVRIPDAGFGGNMSESVVARNPDVFKPVTQSAVQEPSAAPKTTPSEGGFFNFPADELPTNRDATAGVLGLSADVPKVEVLGAGYGQTDMRLTLPDVKGQIDYSVFEGRPKINMIEVPESARRQGNATKLLQALQGQFPDTEIDWGSLTTDGSSLFQSTNFSEIPSAYAGDFARLDAAKSRLAAMQSDFAGMQARNQSPPAGFFDEWNNLQDEIDITSRELEFKSPVERIIAANRDATAGVLGLGADVPKVEVLGVADGSGPLVPASRNEGHVAMERTNDYDIFRYNMNGKTIGELWKDRGTGLVEHVQVDPDFRRRGIGTELYDSAGINSPSSILSDDAKAFWDSRRQSANNTTPILPAARTEAEAVARQVLEMRAAGRAGDVTEAMMAQADPQYMFNNTPLPMDAASRMGRAEAAGRIDDQYHATLADIHGFIPSETGLSGRGVYTGDYPTDIADYATKQGTSEGLNIIPVLAPPGETYARNIDWQRVIDADEAFPWNATIDETVEGFKRAADTMSGQGYSGVHNQPGERVTFNPTNLRSRFARFDPEFRHLANLNASVALPLAGILAAQREDERQRQPSLLGGR